MTTKAEQNLIDYLDELIQRDMQRDRTGIYSAASTHDVPAAKDPLRAAMRTYDWIPARDMFGNIVSWQHRKTGHTVKHEAALDLWREHKALPPPF